MPMRAIKHTESQIRRPEMAIGKRQPSLGGLTPNTADQPCCVVKNGRSPAGLEHLARTNPNQTQTDGSVFAAVCCALSAD